MLLFHSKKSYCQYKLLKRTAKVLCFSKEIGKDRKIRSNQTKKRFAIKPRRLGERGSHKVGPILITCRSVYREIRLVNGIQLALSLTNHKCQPVLTPFHFCRPLLSIIFSCFYFSLVPIFISLESSD